MKSNININRIRLLSTETPVVTIYCSINNETKIYFQSENFTSDGSWHLDPNDTSHIVCDLANTYTIVWNLYTSNGADRTLMSYDNDTEYVYATYVDYNNRTLTFTNFFDEGEYIDFYSVICRTANYGEAPYCAYGINGNCTVDIYLGNMTPT
jgi:hypothetical protein